MAHPTRMTPRASVDVPARPWSAHSGRVMPVALGVLLLVHLALRVHVLARGNFYWDDLILSARAGTHGFLAPSLLFDDHDGHLMPAAMALVDTVTAVAPLSWPVAAATLLLGQLVATASVARMVVVVAGWRPAALVALAFYLLTPMAVPSFAWWASGLNNLPMQAAMAWVVTDVVLLTRDRAGAASGGPRSPAIESPPVGSRTIVVRSTVVFAVALAFFEKSALILPVAFAVALLGVRLSQLARDPGEPTRALPAVWRRASGLWISLAAVAAVWAVAFWVIGRPTAGEHSLRQTAALVWRAVSDGVVPAVAGGPWTWDRWVPSPPFGTPTVSLQVVGWLIVIGAVVAAVRARHGAVAIVVSTVGYIVVAQALVSWNRSSTTTALELSQTLRYLPDTAVVLVAAAALVIAAPARPGGHPSRRLRMLGSTVVAFTAIGSVVSTVTFAASWSHDPTGDYVRTARASLAASADTPMFSQPVPLEVLTPVAYPDNLVDTVFSGLSTRPEFGDWTDDLRVLSPRGAITPGAVTRTRAFAAGAGACDRPEVTGPTMLPLDGPLIRWRWTVQFAYCANAGGEVEVRIGDSAPVIAPVEAGLHGLWVQASGTGTTVSVRPRTPGLALHLAAGVVGEVYDPALLR
ncbi:hypothetical protein ACQ7HM_09895 [Williamsia sp. MIQD14]|uniref:hypothetical protein n=1 Tax=Williamsia sp. MIQD14 TaxID=3425703 RepID=UPI003DA15D88